MSRQIKIVPSILAADFARIGEAIAAAEAGGADQIHIDVMDGHFVPNISMGPGVVESVRHVTSLPLDVHLMISDPDRYLQAFADAGADALTVHVEATPHIHRTLQHIRTLGLRAGVALNPGTPIAALQDIVQGVDIVLVMSVNPGFGGQTFIPHTLVKLRQTRQLLDSLGHSADISVDGGVGLDNAGEIVAAGASMLVAGSTVFQARQEIAEVVGLLRRAAQEGLPAGG